VCDQAFFGAKNPYKKSNETQHQFLEDFMLYICKRYMALSICENIWLRMLNCDKCQHVAFPFHFVLMEEMFLTMVTNEIACVVASC
jgi:hypothetical protein